MGTYSISIYSTLLEMVREGGREGREGRRVRVSHKNDSMDNVSFGALIF